MGEFFGSYLFKRYPKRRHIRRVGTWLGFVTKAVVEKIGGNPRLSHSRQLRFDYKGIPFKVFYNHGIKRGVMRGGIAIAEVLPGKGGPQGKWVVEIGSLDEAEDFYLNPKKALNAFLAQNS